MRLFVLILAILLDQVGLGSVISINNFEVNKINNNRANLSRSFLNSIKPNFYKTNNVSGPNILPKSFVVLDSNSSDILLEKNSNIKAPMASLTKIMTAVIVLENSSLEDSLIVSRNAVAAYGEGIDLHYDEDLTIKDTLYAALLSSSNDACVALAEKVAGSEKNFVELMNRKVEGLGLSETHFANVSGLDDVDHYSNVLDLAKLTRYALLSSTFREIVATKEKVITSKQGIHHYLKNTNKLLGVTEGVAGVKTGLTGDAGECLITLVEREGSSLLIVVLGSSDRFGDTRILINWVYDNFSWK